MLSFTGSRSLFGTLTNNSSPTNLTLGDTLINLSTRRILSMGNWDFLEGTQDITSVASQQAYKLAHDYEKLISVKVVVGSTNYTPAEVSDRKTWDRISWPSITSDIPEYYFVFGGQILLYPTPATTNATITVIYKKRQRDLSIADYTTGNIVSVANGGTAIVGSGTTWTASMVGRYIRITETDGANAGDGYWYKISAYTSATAITIDKPYNGTAIAVGSAAYTIGQVSILPEEFQELPVYDAVTTYFTSVQPEQSQADRYKVMFLEGMKRLMNERGSKGTSPVVWDGLERETINPNLTIRL